MACTKNEGSEPPELRTRPGDAVAPGRPGPPLPGLRGDQPVVLSPTLQAAMTQPGKASGQVCSQASG